MLEFTSIMRKMTYLVLVLSLWPFISQGQTPKRIHDLKSLTDSSGTVHLFYRIYSEYEGTEYFTDNIYQYNTETGEKELFLEDYFDDRYGFELKVTIPDYQFFEGNLEKYLYIQEECSNECERYLNRFDSLRVVGGYFMWVEDLLVPNSENEVIYAKVSAQNLKSFDGGLTWPTRRQIEFSEVPDSVKIDIPAFAFNPYRKNLLFGHNFRSGGDDNFFYRSVDNGESSEIVSDTLFPIGEMSFDLDSTTVFMLDVINAPRQENPFTPNTCPDESCAIGLYKSNGLGEIGTWELVNVFSESVKIISSDVNIGEIYAWDNHSIRHSSNYGNDFNILYNNDEVVITGLDINNGELFFSTNSTIYKLEENQPIPIYSIPTSIEDPKSLLPSKIKLNQNYPNPFNPSTVIRFRLSQSTQVSLKIYDVLGNLVQTLVSEEALPAGEHHHTWNAGSNISSGVYFYRLVTGQEVLTKKMILIK
ncbi:MAG: T9SS type A sorting domain-containing protein [Gracilimonas sp.]|uniref:T9SS type A sorting domain-containing protein n=1 Tax=Gracilimonas sp. TaxID=1974203 RepID=UPI001B289754|nr:T9SS type A sorting domain-containing protein [Gracilimonas sp.]MBO6586180.1 T9SS type A sorting domain-containing protein [Gracilimonas sp.]MBO6614837.1 T9SS type A sorting domain-containing protein [Gracilimonas sp.]